MSETVRQFKAEVAQQNSSFVEKESAWKKFLKGLIKNREAFGEMHQKMHKAAKKFEEAGRPIGGAQDD